MNDQSQTPDPDLASNINPADDRATRINTLTDAGPGDTLDRCADALAFLASVEPVDNNVPNYAEREGYRQIMRTIEAALRFEAEHHDEAVVERRRSRRRLLGSREWAGQRPAALVGQALLVKHARDWLAECEAKLAELGAEHADATDELAKAEGGTDV